MMFFDWRILDDDGNSFLAMESKYLEYISSTRIMKKYLSSVLVQGTSENKVNCIHS
jgi:hypothetical protein